MQLLRKFGEIIVRNEPNLLDGTKGAVFVYC